MSKDQNYQNHLRFVPAFHFFVLPLLLLLLGGSSVLLYRSFGDPLARLNAFLLLGVVICTIFIFFFARIFALKAQDRAIRAEENLRHFVLTGKLLDSRLRLGQIIALRFAPDDEFVRLAQEAVDQKRSSKEIKQAIQKWRGDFYRV